MINGIMTDSSLGHSQKDSRSLSGKTLAISSSVALLPATSLISSSFLLVSTSSTRRAFTSSFAARIDPSIRVASLLLSSTIFRNLVCASTSRHLIRAMEALRVSRSRGVSSCSTSTAEAFGAKMNCRIWSLRLSRDLMAATSEVTKKKSVVAMVTGWWSLWWWVFS